MASPGQIYQEDISVLLPLLHGVFPYWEQFGCHLPVSYDSIKGIQKGSGPHKGVKDKLTDVLHWYKCKSGPKKWNDVIKALKDIRNNDLASRVPQNGDVPVQATNYISLMLEQYHLKEVAVEWKSFGMQLGIPYLELKAFDQERITPRQCMEELLIIWIQHRGRDATMAAIIKACEGVGDYALAETLAENRDVKRIMCRTATKSYPDQTRIEEVDMNTTTTDQQDSEIAEKARSILISNQSKLKDIIISSGLMNIVYKCEEKSIITETTKTILVSTTTGQTEDNRAYHLLDNVRSVIGHGTEKQMDDFLCVLFENGGSAGRNLAIQMAEEFGQNHLQLFTVLVQNYSKRKIKEIKIEVPSSPPPPYDSDQPDKEFDSKKLLNKSPRLEDVLEVVTDDCDCQQFREALRIPSGAKGSLKDAINYWIKEEPSDVTWRNLLKGLKEISKTNTVRFILNNYLNRPSVYRRYIDCSDFESLEDLGI